MGDCVRGFRGPLQSHLLRNYTPKSHQLAVTVALEHYTAMLAGHVLATEDALARTSQPGYRQVWM